MAQECGGKMKKLISISLMLMCMAVMSYAAANNSPGDDYVLIKGGSFTMGSPANEDWRSSDETVHTVSVGSFWLSRYEVTQSLYRSIMKDNPSDNIGDNLPVESVTWTEAITFCNELSRAKGRTPVYTISSDGRSVTWDRAADGYRLPTEAEWEYAARAGTKTPFWTKKVPGADDVNFYGHYPYQIEQNYFHDEVLETRPGVYRGHTIAVGSFQANPWGLFDIYGNVGEWCFDLYGEYDISRNNNPTGVASGTRHVHRGGGWNDFGKNLRSAYRAAAPSDNRLPNVGIRLAVSADNVLRDKVTISESAESTASKPSAKKTLIVYYSWSGNTRGVANEIRRQTGFDAVELTLVKPYSQNYNKVLNEAQHDQHIQARPALAVKIDNFDQYDTVILGYPNWWASIPMPIATLLESYDFSGKTILPFCSHGGGRFGQSLTAIAKLAPNAKLGEGLSVHYSGGGSLSKDVTKWLAKNGMR